MKATGLTAMPTSVPLPTVSRLSATALTGLFHPFLGFKQAWRGLVLRNAKPSVNA